MPRMTVKTAPMITSRGAWIELSLSVQLILQDGIPNQNAALAPVTHHKDSLTN